MAGIATAVGAAAVIGAGASIYASNQQANAAQNAQNIQQGMFNTAVANEAPYVQSGNQAQSQLNYLLGNGKPGSNGTAGSSTAGGYGSLLTPFTAQNFQQLSPAYQFQLQQGQQGVLNTDSGSQGALSGAALKDLTGYNQGMANTSFNNAFNQYQTQQGNIYSRLASVAQTGQAAASNQATGASNFGSSIGQSATNVGSALGGGTVGAGNALSGGASSLGGIYAAYGGGGQFDPSGVGSLSSLSQSDLPNASMYLNNDIAVSDRRLKKNIRRIGQTEGGQPWYEFEYIDKPGLHTGVMADESPPEAVSYSADGYAMVDYLRIR